MPRGQTINGQTLTEFVQAHFEEASKAVEKTAHQIRWLLEKANAEGFTCGESGVSATFYAVRKKASGKARSPSLSRQKKAAADSVDPARLERVRAVIQEFKDAGNKVGKAMVENEQIIADLTAENQQLTAAINQLDAEVTELREYKKKYLKAQEAFGRVSG
jgi:hypothetical protein